MKKTGPKSKKVRLSNLHNKSLIITPKHSQRAIQLQFRSKIDNNFIKQNIIYNKGIQY